MIGARIAVVVVLVGCRSQVARIEPMPAAPPPVLDPARDAALPPVAPGHVRLASLDLDTVAPPDARVTTVRPGYEQVSWGMCAANIYADWDRTPQRRVGTLSIYCQAQPPCQSACDALAPVPGGTAEDVYPAEPPVIEISSGGGNSGEFVGAARVWTDGTVQFFGGACKKWRGRRGKLPPERVAALLAALDRGGFFRFEPPAFDPCPDMTTTGISVRAHGKRQRVSTRMDCAHDDPPIIGDAIAAVQGVVGPNPCAR